MKILYGTSNIRGIQDYINSLLSNNNPEFDSGNDPKINTCNNYIFVLLEINKDTDNYLMDDMRNALIQNMHKLKSTKIIETSYMYYMSISLNDMYILSTDEYNLFSIKIKCIVTTMYAKANLQYKISKRSNCDFYIIDDMKSLTHSYLNILENTDLTREDLNSLMRFAIYIKAPINTMISLKNNTQLNYNVFSSYSHRKMGINTHGMNHKLTYQLNRIALSSNVSLDNANITTNANKILEFVDNVQQYFPYYSDRVNLITLSNKCDGVLYNTISEIIEFSNNSQYGYIYKDIITYLNYNVNIAEFILTGKVRN